MALHHPMSDSRPVYLRLREEIASAIIDGRYPEGAMLPSVRAFAAEQGANPLTVAKAYQQFQADGLIRVHEWPQVRKRMALLGIEPADVLDDA